MDVCCECCVLAGTGFCDKPIARPEESYQQWRIVCDLETSRMSRPWQKKKFRLLGQDMRMQSYIHLPQIGISGGLCKNDYESWGFFNVGNNFLTRWVTNKRFAPCSFAYDYANNIAIRPHASRSVSHVTALLFGKPVCHGVQSPWGLMAIV